MKEQLLLVMSILMLQGCVIGSGNNDNVPSPENTNLNQRIVGSYLKIDATKIDEGILSGTDFNNLKVGSKNLSIQLPNTTSGVSDFHTKTNGLKSYARYIVSDKKYNQTRFGLVKMENESYLFSQGYASRDVPKSGEYIYNGEAAVSLNHQHQYGGYSGIASVTSTVDFAKKSIMVKIITPEVHPQEINFGATIHGNTFSGDQGYISDGGFYGKNAEELSGYFIDHADNFGAFGGKKVMKVQ